MSSIGVSAAPITAGAALPFEPVPLSRNWTRPPGTRMISVENRSESSPSFFQRRVWTGFSYEVDERKPISLDPSPFTFSKPSFPSIQPSGPMPIWEGMKVRIA